MSAAPSPALRISAFAALILSGAIFGFFYAWVCSTMWGLDAADPRMAIAAMQAMNASVRNFAFAPAFFATAPVLVLTALLAWREGVRPAALAFVLAGGCCLFGAFLLTILVNVPMNLALAEVVIPADAAEAGAIWRAYSGPWQFWNLLRTVVSGAVLVLTGAGLWMLGRAEGHGRPGQGGAGAGRAG